MNGWTTGVESEDMMRQSISAAWVRGVWLALLWLLIQPPVLDAGSADADAASDKPDLTLVSPAPAGVAPTDSVSAGADGVARKIERDTGDTTPPIATQSEPMSLPSIGPTHAAAATDVPSIIEPIDLRQLETATRPMSVAPKIASTPPAAGKIDSQPSTLRDKLRESARGALPDTYTIQAGDTLGHIAQRLYGRAGEHAAIAAANPGIDPRGLQVGQVIRLPRRAQTRQVVMRGDAPAVAERATADGARRVEDGSRRVEVRAGDSLYRIAEREYGNGGRWRVIYQANRDVIDEPSMLQPGMKLMIPKRTEAQGE